MGINKDNDKGIKLLLAIIYPFGAFLYSLRDLKSRSSYWVFFFFILIYGLCFNAEAYDKFDSSRYLADFLAFSSNAEYNFTSAVSEFFSKDSDVKDIFVYVLYYLTNILAGNNYHVLFFLVAIVFGYFNLRSLKFITNDSEFKNTAFYYVLALIFVFSNSIFNINSIRFWTASWVAVYATFQVLINDKRSYLLLLLTLPLIPGSFYIYWIFFVGAYIIRRYYKILPYVFFISFFFTDVLLMIIPSIEDYLPPFMQKMVWAYTISEGAQERIAGADLEDVPLYARILTPLPRYFSLLLIFLLVRSYKNFKDDKSREFLGFILGYGSLVNISSMVPSMGRYWYILIPFYVYLWVHNSSILMKHKQIVLLFPVIALYALFQVGRNIVWTTDPLLFITNSIHLIIRNLS